MPAQVVTSRHARYDTFMRAPARMRYASAAICCFVERDATPHIAWRARDAWSPAYDVSLLSFHAATLLRHRLPRRAFPSFAFSFFASLTSLIFYAGARARFMAAAMLLVRYYAMAPCPPCCHYVTFAAATRLLTAAAAWSSCATPPLLATPAIRARRSPLTVRHDADFRAIPPPVIASVLPMLLFAFRKLFFDAALPSFRLMFIDDACFVAIRSSSATHHVCVLFSIPLFMPYSFFIMSAYIVIIIRCHTRDALASPYRQRLRAGFLI